MKELRVPITERLALLIERRGAVVAAVAGLSALVFLSWQAAPERFHRRIAAERPGGGAVRSYDGPGASRREPRPMPEFVKGIYATAFTASDKKALGRLVELVEKTELNSLVIDVKNGKGELAFEPSSAVLADFAEPRPSLGRLAAFTAPLRDRGIYLIARLVVFQDPIFAAKRPDLAVGRKGGGLWRDRRGTPWLDPSAEEVWRHAVRAAKEAYDGGFDEVQFDYVRFPSDGDLGSISYPLYDGKKTKAEVIGEFFAYLDRELRVKSGIPISADVFGLTMWMHDYDLNIGQRLESAAAHFDAVSPMVYPSHYAAGFNGFANPAEHPYEVVRDNMERGKLVIERLRERSRHAKKGNPLAPPLLVASVRPWIQDFDMGAVYDAGMVRGQMTAAAEGGAGGWLIWNAKNVYTEAALEKEE